MTTEDFSSDRTRAFELSQDQNGTPVVDTEFMWLPKAELDLAFDATAEIDYMLSLVAQELRHQDNVIANGSMTRLVSFLKTIQKATSVAISITGQEEGRDFGEMYDEIHGGPLIWGHKPRAEPCATSNVRGLK